MTIKKHKQYPDSLNGILLLYLIRKINITYQIDITLKKSLMQELKHSLRDGIKFEIFKDLYEKT